MVKNNRDCNFIGENYRHFNSLIWQVPSWGVAIAAGVVVAANQINTEPATWNVPTRYVQASILGFGFFLLTALTIALYKYRIYQAAFVPSPPPSPPFQMWPSANKFLQWAMCFTTGGIGGLAVSQLISNACPIIVGFGLSVIAWFIFETRNKSAIRDLNKAKDNTS